MGLQLIEMWGMGAKLYSVSPGGTGNSKPDLNSGRAGSRMDLITSKDYTVEVRNRFKGLDLIDRVTVNYGMRFMTLYRRQGSRPSPWKRNAKKQNGC